MRKHVLLLAALLLVLFLPMPSYSLDTTEPYPLGASEFEMYYDYVGIGKSKSNTSMAASALVGFGITPSISTFIAPSFSSDGFLLSDPPEFTIGVFGTVIDTNHFDFDLGFTMVHPMMLALDFEMNFDLENDLKLAGVYLRGRVSTSSEESRDAEDHQIYNRFHGLEEVLGFYYTFKEGVQFLQENYFSLKMDDAFNMKESSYDGSALGLNIMLHSNIELLLSFYINKEDSEWYFGGGIGAIMTVDYNKLANSKHE